MGSEITDGGQITGNMSRLDVADPPSPQSNLIPRPNPSPHRPPCIPIPGTSSVKHGRPIAGPSSEGAIPRRASNETIPSSSPTAPSSAPPTPSVIAMTHPSPYIHTHHPRRGSMTPLGLHVISPVPPIPSPQPNSPIRSVGFSPTHPPIDLAETAARRGSAASTCSTLTQSRPSAFGVSAATPPFPSGLHRERRRSSLTPSTLTLAAPSPTRTHPNGRLRARPSSSDGPAAPPMHARTRTADGAPKQLSSLASSRGTRDVGEQGRRGSLPQLGIGGYTKAWNPSLPPQRGRIDDGALPDEGFKFGTGVAGPSTMATSLKRHDLSPSSQRSSWLSSGKRKEDMNAFEEAEAEEAERQRRAFLKATYGEDGRRARERLSLAGPSGSGGNSPATPGATLRRQSLLLWERLSTARAAETGLEGNLTESVSAMLPPVSPIALFNEDLPPRRGSLPITIPGGGIGRRSSRRRAGDLDALPKAAKTGEEEDDEENSDEEEDVIDDALSRSQRDTLHAPMRPLPPLLPLSDPGPRLLPSTLALHRANHLLSSRNLQAEPLPHPLPPSLHPPAPVDLAEFDIDFILAGSQTQLGGDQKSSSLNAPIDVIHSKDDLPVPPTPTFKLGGGEDEDSFAKFVGAFDDEYGDRRGEWTFRARPLRSMPSRSPTPRDPLNPTGPPVPKSEWDCIGAGKYELYTTGEVRSIQTGSVWRVQKTAAREYEMEQIERGEEKNMVGSSDETSTKPTVISSHECCLLTCKASHCEYGGVKMPGAQPITSLTDQSTNPARVNTSDSPRPDVQTERTDRIGSANFGATVKLAGVIQSLPLVSVLSPKKNPRIQSHVPESDMPPVPPPSAPSAQSSGGDSPRELDHVDEKKKDKSIGGVLKRAFKGTLGMSEERKAAREERREWMQSQSWSPGNHRRKDYTYPSGKHLSSTANQRRTTSSANAGERNPTSRGTSVASRAASDSSGDMLAATSVPSTSTVDDMRQSPMIGGNDLEVPMWREGKAWEGVPEESVAMVVPIESNVGSTRPRPTHRISDTSDTTRQALLVWYVPFNSENDDRQTTAASSVFSRASSEAFGTVTQTTPKGGDSSSTGTTMPKFQKLLRRRVSKEKEGLRREKDQGGTGGAGGSGSGVRLGGVDQARISFAHPLPFRSFRVVARVVDVDDLKSEQESGMTNTNTQPGPSLSSWRASLPAVPFHHSNLGSTGATGTTLSPESSNPSSLRPQTSLPTSTDEHDGTSSLSTAPTSTILAGRSFPTVIAVCHSRSQGVEFVLEGLDRLGFCQGQSAWGPTGYEEWRGGGLSGKGRELLDLLWAGCTGVMGLTGMV